MGEEKRFAAPPPDRVRLGLLVSSPDELFRTVAEDLHAAGLGGDPNEIARALAEREAVHSTAIGAGLAIPHARTSACDRSRFVAIRLGAALDFDSPDGIPVDLVFVLLGPPGDPGGHVRQLAALARCLQCEGVPDALRRAADEEAFRRALAGRAAA